MINHKGLVKISDFGIAKQLHDSSHSASTTPSSADGVCSTIMTTSRSSDSEAEASQTAMKKTHTFVGTAAYMSPERIDGRDYSFPSDVWAFGLIMVALANGHIPIDTQSGYWAMLHAIRDMPPPELNIEGEWSDDFRDFLGCCLKKDASQRSTCSQLLQHRFLQNRTQEDQNVESVSGPGKEELLALLRKAAEHLLSLKSESPDSGDSFKLHSLMDTLIFSRRSGTLEESRSSHRLWELCRQLSVSESEGVACANEFLDEISKIHTINWKEGSDIQ